MKSDYKELLTDIQDHYKQQLKKQSKLFGVGITLPTEKEMIIESRKEADKYSHNTDVLSWNAINKGFEKCYRWIRDKEK